MRHSRLFVLQVWIDPERFRAALRAVDETETLRFSTLRLLCEHIACIARAMPQADQADAAVPALPGTFPDAAAIAGADARADVHVQP